MRALSMTCLMLGLFLQIGCALTSDLIVKQNSSPNSPAAAQFIAAKKLENQGSLEKARELYEALLFKHPENPEYLHRMAVVCTGLQRDGEANYLYEKARLLDPKNASLLTDFGYSSYLRGDYAEAEQLLREAAHLKRGDKRVVRNLAIVVGCQGRIEESLALLREIGSEANALASAGYIHCLRGEFDLAERRYRDALTLDPNLKDATRALIELSSQRTQKDLHDTNANPATVDVFPFADIHSLPSETSLIQKFAGVVETAERTLTTAQCVDESCEAEKPGLLEKEVELPGRARITMTPFMTVQSNEGDGQFDDEVSPFLIPSVRSQSISPNHDWSAEVMAAKAKSNGTKSKSPTEMETESDDESSWMKQSVPSPVSTSTSTRLTFVPRRSQTIQQAPNKSDEADEDFTTPTKLDEIE